MRTSTVATASQESNNDPFHPQFAIIVFKMESSSFSLVYDKQTQPLFLAMTIFFFCLRSEEPRDSLLSHQPLSASKDCGYHE